MTKDPKDTFNRWFVVPLRKLERIPDGDGAFVAMPASCCLYERYVLATQGTSKKKVIYRQLSQDFHIDTKTAQVFWDLIRNGILHQAMPKAKSRSLPEWEWDDSFPDAIALSDTGRVPKLNVQPWRFTNRVLELCESNLGLIIQNPKNPWAIITD